MDDKGNKSLLDGVNRLDALEQAGKRAINEHGKLTVPWLERDAAATPDPYSYVISANIRRRHLTTDQKRELIEKLIKLDPSKSDRQIAKTIGVDHKTVAAVRSEGERRGEFPHVETRTDTKGRKQSRARKSSNNKVAPDLSDAEFSAKKRKAEAALVDQQLDNVCAHADFSEPQQLDIVDMVTAAPPPLIDDDIPDFLRRTPKPADIPTVVARTITLSEDDAVNLLVWAAQARDSEICHGVRTPTIAPNIDAILQKLSDQLRGNLEPTADPATAETAFRISDVVTLLRAHHQLQHSPTVPAGENYFNPPQKKDV